MIYIVKNQNNKVVLTLCESSRLTNPFYLFEFTNEYILGSEPILFSTPNLSTSTNRYDLFNITESNVGSTTGGYDVPLLLTSGQYRYNVYESSAMTLTISETTGVILESGRMVVQTDDNDIIITASTNSIYQ